MFPETTSMRALTSQTDQFLDGLIILWNEIFLVVMKGRR